MKRFNIRVYGVVKSHDKVLVTDEFRSNIEMTKFPGGGLEHGEGIKDCLIREFQEEFGTSIIVKELFYITDFYIASAFNPNDQLISIYYLVDFHPSYEVEVVKERFEFKERCEGAQCFRWIDIKNLREDDFTFPVDKHVASLLKQKYGN